MVNVLSARAARVLTLALVAQASLFYGFSRREQTPPTPPLAAFPARVGAWQLSQEGYVDKETADALHADDLLTRTYTAASVTAPVNLFVAYFRTQRTGQSPHSPKNCLPGSGWSASKSEILQLRVPDRTAPIEANEYVVTKGDQKSVVLYWYQSRDRTVASEFRARFYAVADSIRYNHSDTALVRVVTPVVNDDEAGAVRRATEFVQASFQTLRGYFPA